MEELSRFFVILQHYDEENRNSMRGIDAAGINGSEVTGL
jgi:hypothetical protein